MEDVTFSAASRQSPFDTAHGRKGLPMRLFVMMYLALGVVCSLWFLCVMLVIEGTPEGSSRLPSGEKQVVGLDRPDDNAGGQQLTLT
jgi:hypothetical protein